MSRYLSPPRIPHGSATTTVPLVTVSVATDVIVAVTVSVSVAFSVTVTRSVTVTDPAAVVASETAPFATPGFAVSLAVSPVLTVSVAVEVAVAVVVVVESVMGMTTSVSLVEVLTVEVSRVVGPLTVVKKGGIEKAGSSWDVAGLGSMVKVMTLVPIVRVRVMSSVEGSGTGVTELEVVADEVMVAESVVD